jgi:iron(III) transport system ATP-binding protein
MSTLLEMRDICHAYGEHLVVKDFSLQLSRGSIGCLLGPSGCGKTTVLRAIAGFEDIIAGEILLNGEMMSGNGICVEPEKRRIGMVFQDYALFPHLTAYENISFGLRKIAKTERLKRASRLLETLLLEDLEGKYPHQLSGGQQQRVALARALAPRPDLVLLDEPFSNLDVGLREKLSIEVRNILKEYGATALLVTHNQLEAFAVSDEIGIMYKRELQQWGSAHDLYHHPATPFVADFVGEGVLIQGVVLDNTRVSTSLGVLRGAFSCPCAPGCAVDVLIRPDDIVHDDDSPVRSKVMDKTFRGANIMYRLLLSNGERLMSIVPSHHDHPVGQKIGIRPVIDDIVLFVRGEHPQRELSY